MHKLLMLLIVPILASGIALAADPANPADPGMVAALLPGYIFVEGIDDGNELRLLMRNPAHELVFIGGVARDGAWHFAESPPAPGHHPERRKLHPLLGHPNGTYYNAVSVSPYADGSWGVSLVYPNENAMVFMGKHVIYEEVHEIDGHFGDHPWSDITTIDWTSLPGSYAEAIACVDSSNWAVVSNPNPEDRLHLRVSPDKDAVSRGKYYNGTPVRIRKYGNEWCAVTVCGLDGYMMTKYLAFGGDMDAVEYAGPGLFWKEALTPRLYTSPHANSAFTSCPGDRAPSFHVMGVAGDFYHVWLPDTEEYGYVRMDDLWPGNG